MEEKQGLLRGRIEDCLVSITWSHKIHEKQADLLLKAGKRWCIASIVVTALTVTGAASLFSSLGIWLQVATTLLACVSLFLFVYTLTFDHSGKAADNRAAAKAFLALREEGRDLLAAFDAGLSHDEAIERYTKLSEKNQVACALAPRTEEAAVEKARQALDSGESIVSDKERVDLCGDKEG